MNRLSDLFTKSIATILDHTTNNTAESSPRANRASVWFLAAAIGAGVLALPTTSHAATSGPARVNCGGPAVAPFVADVNFSGGTALTRTNTIDLSNVSSPAPMAVYQSQRFGNMTYTFPGFAASSSNTVRLHFADTHFTTTGSRKFNVSINGTQVLSNYDVVAHAGGGNKAITETFTAAASSSGAYVIQFTSVTDQATISAIEITNSGFTQVNCGGPAVAPYLADTNASGGTQLTRTNTIDLSGVTNPAPMAVYQSQRFGNMTYTFGGVPAGSANKVRLHFADTHFTTPGARTFNVTINGVQALTNFDIVAQAGGGNKAFIASFTMIANSSGQYVIQFTSIVDQASISAIEIQPPVSGLEAVNMALGKPTSASSVAFGGDPSRAVDGVSDGVFADNSVTHTGLDANSWWEVDLGAGRQIGNIEIDLRTDCCTERSFPLMVIVSDNTIFDSDMFIDPPLDGVQRTVIGGPVNNVVTIPVNRGGRYVRIALLEQNYLSLAEVKVFEAFNSARGRTASQSSTRTNGDASHAIDGNVSGIFARGEVAATNSQTNPWWQVDMGLVSMVREVDVWSFNTDCCMGVGPLYRVYASPTPFTSDPSVSLPPGAFKSITLGHDAPTRVFVGINARYIRVQMIGTDSLSLAEVQVYSTATGAVGGHPILSPPATTPVDPYTMIDLNPFNASTFATGAGTDPHFDLDLGFSRYIEAIRVWGQSTASSAQTFSIFVSENPFPGPKASDLRGHPDIIEFLAHGSASDSTTVIMNEARFIRVVIEGANQALGMGEVEVVATQGYLLNPANGTASTSPSTTVHANGFFTSPSVEVDMYQYQPPATPATGFDNNFTYLFTGLTGTTPVLTSLATVPLYAFDMGNVPLKSGVWVKGGVTALFARAYDFPGAFRIATPLRNVDADGAISAFGPITRLVSTSPTPDDNANSKKVYLTIPMPGANFKADYYNKFGIFDSKGNATYLEMPTTLTAFNAQYGMTSSTAVNAKYYNAGDLGIGRNMTCNRASWTPPGKAKETGTVCAVSNYAPPSGLTSPPNAPVNFGDQTGSLALLKSGAPFATVVMVKRDEEKAAMFGVYLGATGARIQQNVFLDSVGLNTNVPNNCVPCHGGLAGSDPDAIVNDSLLPFDPTAFGFGAAPLDFASQAESFRKLNQMVLQSTPAPAIQQFINKSYGDNVAGTGQAVDLTFVPAGWNHSPDQAKVYNQVIKPGCRGCHWSQFDRSSANPSQAPNPLDFSDALQMEGLRTLIISDVCVTHRMPHSQLVTKNIWPTTARAQMLGYFGRNDVGTQDFCKPTL